MRFHGLRRKSLQRIAQKSRGRLGPGAAIWKAIDKLPSSGNMSMSGAPFDRHARSAVRRSPCRLHHGCIDRAGLGFRYLTGSSGCQCCLDRPLSSIFLTTLARSFATNGLTIISTSGSSAVLKGTFSENPLHTITGISDRSRCISWASSVPVSLDMAKSAMTRSK